MQNKILEVIKNLDSSKVKSFKINQSKEFRVLHYVFCELNLSTIEEIAARIAVSIEKKTTTIEKLKDFLAKQESINNRKLLTFDSYLDFLKFREANQDLKLGKSWKDGRKELVYQY